MKRPMSKKIEILLLAVFLSASIAVITSSEAAAKRMSYKLLYKLYVANKPLHRAIATSDGRSIGATGTSCGAANTYPTKQSAANEAIRQCNVDRKHYKTRGTCKIIEAK
jgi:hypothetical protein